MYEVHALQRSGPRGFDVDDCIVIIKCLLINGFVVEKMSVAHQIPNILGKLVDFRLIPFHPLLDFLSVDLFVIYHCLIAKSQGVVDRTLAIPSLNLFSIPAKPKFLVIALGIHVLTQSIDHYHSSFRVVLKISSEDPGCLWILFLAGILCADSEFSLEDRVIKSKTLIRLFFEKSCIIWRKSVWIIWDNIVVRATTPHFDENLKNSMKNWKFFPNLHYLEQFHFFMF